MFLIYFDVKHAELHLCQKVYCYYNNLHLFSEHKTQKNQK